jgi:hypothetical protein
MPRKLSPEEAAVLIIRRRLRQMEEDKMSDRESGEKDPAPEEKAPKSPGRSNEADNG